MTQPLGPVTIEPELRGPTPRPLRFRTGTQLARVFLVLLCLGIPLLLGALLDGARQQAEQLARQGRIVQARVTSRHASGRSDGYSLNYEFPLDGRTETGSQSVSEAVYDRTSAGDPLTITYLPAHPGVQRLGKVDAANVKEERMTEGLILGMLLPVFGGLAGYLEWYFRRQLSLLRNGVAVRADLVEWSEPGPGRYPLYYITYEYDVPNGQRLRKTLPVKAQIGAALVRQQTATVLYNPRKPQESNFYLALDARLPAP